MSVSSYESSLRQPFDTKARLADRAARVDAARRFLSAFLANGYSASCLDAAIALGPAWMCQQGLAPLVWFRWQHDVMRDAPADFATAMCLHYYAAVGDAELHQHELFSALIALQAQGLAPVVFKGAALAHTIYPDPACRPMSDLDLWLSADEMPCAETILEALAYRTSFRPTRPRAMMIQSHHEMPLYGMQPGDGLVELHWGVFPGEWLRRTANVDEQAVRSRVIDTTLACCFAKILSPEDALIQLAVHFAVGHQVGWPWLRTLVDVTLFVRTQPIDWNVIVDRVRTWRVATATWLVLSLAIDLTSLSEATDAARRLAPSRLRQKLIGSFANADSLVARRDLSKSKWRYVYLLRLVDRRRDVVRLIFRTLWPEREWLVVRYDRAGTSIRLRHLLNAARGRI